MLVFRSRKAASDSVHENAEIAQHAAGGRTAAIVSVLAIIFSGFSFYETVLRQPHFRVFVPPVIQYSHPGRNTFEVFNIPVTVSNYGARSGTILSMDLDVTNLKTKQTKRFYSAAFGRWNDSVKGALPSFTPISVAGKDSYSGELLFYTRVGEEIQRILDQEGGSYSFLLRPNMATPDDLGFFDKIWETNVKPIQFNMEINALDYRNFSNGGTMAMYNKQFRSTVGGSSRK